MDANGFEIDLVSNLKTKNYDNRKKVFRIRRFD